jgi:hypothetical protein
MALLGFFCALLMHANLRGDGNIINGVVAIYKEDVRRSTLAGWSEVYGANNKGSMDASLMDVIISYFKRDEDIISGISGKFFPLLSVLPLLIFSYNGIKKKVEIRDGVLYVVSFLTSISWFVLGKSHSAMHGFLNFVLWNFGYIQICFYIIIKQFLNWGKTKMQRIKT